MTARKAGAATPKTAAKTKQPETQNDPESKGAAEGAPQQNPPQEGGAGEAGQKASTSPATDGPSEEAQKASTSPATDGPSEEAQKASTSPATEDPASAPRVSIASMLPGGHRRIGRRFTNEVIKISLSDLTKAEITALRNDPFLVVVGLD